MNKENINPSDYSSEKGKRENIDEILFFDPAREVEYLKQIDDDKKYVALGQELKTAIQELSFIQGGALERVLENGRIKEPTINTFLDRFVEKDSLDMVAFNKIQEGLKDGNNLVVHFSPQNIEMNYPANVIDFWINQEKDGKINFLRFFVDDNLEKMKSIYKAFGGKEEIKSSVDLLTNPLITNDFRMADIMRNLMVSDKKIETTKNKIDNVVDHIMEDFYSDFENRIFFHKDLINRIFSASYEVALNESSFNEMEINDYLIRRIGNFMYGQISEMKVRNGGGACPGVVKTAEFGPGRGMIISIEDGSFVVKEGNTEGLTFCKKCGCWYSGDNCPLCK